MGLLAVQQLAAAVEHCNHRYALDRSVVFLGYVEVLVAFADVDVHDVIVLIDERLDTRLMKAIVEGKTVEAPVGPEDQQHTFVVFRCSLQRVRNFLVSISIRGI